MNVMTNINKTICAVGICCILALLSPALVQGAMSDYCAAPPFLNNPAPPNVMIMLDNSGSMAEHPFTTTFNPTQFASGYYYGYFEPTWMYQYDAINKLWVHYTGPDPGYGNGDPTQPIASGNLLNWAATRKLEVAKKILVGGNPGVISGVSNPRQVGSGTVKLYSEDEGSSNNVSFDNSNIMSLPSYTFYLVPIDSTTSYSNVIYPFTGNYTYKLGSGGCTGSPGCSKLTISPATGSTALRDYSTPYASEFLPTTNNWTKNPTPFTNHIWSCSDNYSYRCEVRDNDGSENPLNQDDGDTSYIQNRRDTNPIMFGLRSGFSSNTGVIQDVNVVIVAREAEATNGACISSTDRRGRNTYYSRRIQGVLNLSGTNYASAYASLNNTSTTWNQYAVYTFTWANNPATGVPWTWSDITSAFRSFGAQNSDTTVYNGSTDTGCFARISQVYLYIDRTPASGTYSLVVDTGKTQIKGLIDNLSSGARFGLGTYGDSSNGGKVLTYVDFGNMNAIADSVIKMTAGNMTPLAESEYELIRYFRQNAPAFNSNDYTTGSYSSRDPYFYMYSHMSSSVTTTANDKYVPCSKSYILLLTDGEPTADDWRNSAGATVTLPSAVRADTNGNGHLDEIALWARTTDMRAGSCTGPQSSWTFPCIPGSQYIFTYPVFLFGSGSSLLKSTAILGGFSGDPTANNLPPCLDPATPGSPTQDELKACYRPAANNTSGIINPATDPPLTYFEGSDAYALEEGLTQALSDIMRRSASGTSVSVLTTSSRGVGSMLQAYFLPIKQEGARQVTWTGYTQNIWLDPSDNLREDTVHDFKLKLAEDNVIKLFFDASTNQTMAASFSTDVTGSSSPSTPGSLASCSPNQTKPFENVNYLWEGGNTLARTDPETRRIMTANKVVYGTTIPFTFSSPNYFTVSNVTSNATLSAALNPDATYTAENIVRYIRGECLETNAMGSADCTNNINPIYRDRRVGLSGGATYGNVWKLGDVISSTPKVFGNTPLNAYHIVYGDSTYKDYVFSPAFKEHASIAFVGANDGMLHAFRVGYLKDRDDAWGSLGAGVKALFKNIFSGSDGDHDELGQEVWSYIPFNAFPYLKYLADPNYCHLYFNDLPVYLVDASVNGNATTTKTMGSWRTILIGGMRYGGACNGGIDPAGPPAGTPANVGFSSYYAIDVTDAENPVVLWEFTDTDLGYAASYPGIIRTGAQDQNGYWYVAFGSGSKQLPRSGKDLGRNTTGYVYIVDLRTGTLAKKIALDHNAIVGSIFSGDLNGDYVSEEIYFGTAYTNSGWKGKIVRIDIPDQDLSSGSWSPAIKTLFADSYPFTASPDVILDPAGNVWVYSGSGKYESDIDQTDTSQQIFVGFKDQSSGISYPLSHTSLDNRATTNTTGLVTGTTQVCLYSTPSGTTVGSFGYQTVVTSVNASANVAPSTVGWYLPLNTLPSAERIVSNPLAIGGLVDFLTYTPNSDICSSGGDSYLYSLAYNTGVAPAIVAIRSPDITTGTSGNVTVNKRVYLGPGAPPKGESIILPPKSQSDTRETLDKKIQVSTGVIIETKNNPMSSVVSKIVHWLRK